MIEPIKTPIFGIEHSDIYDKINELIEAVNKLEEFQKKQAALNEATKNYLSKL